MQHCCMFVSFRFFRIYSFLIISASFDPRTIHTHARTRLHSLLLLSFLSNGCVCVYRVIYFFSLFSEIGLPTCFSRSFFPRQSIMQFSLLLLLLLRYATVTYFYFILSLSLTLMFLFWRSFALSRFHALSITQSKLVFSLPLLQHISRVASNKKASNL